jgi:hypothetical protein
LKRLLELLFSFSFSLPFSAPSLEDLGVLMIFKEKIASSKTSFQMASTYWWWGIFWSVVMHANMAKPRLWRWESCGYIGGGSIFRSGCMHANIFG